MEPEVARWDWVVTPDEDGTLWMLCTTTTGRPIAVALGEDAEILIQGIRDARAGALNNHLMGGTR